MLTDILAIPRDSSSASQTRASSSARGHRHHHRPSPSPSPSPSHSSPSPRPSRTTTTTTTTTPSTASSISVCEIEFPREAVPEAASPLPAVYVSLADVDAEDADDDDGAAFVEDNLCAAPTPCTTPRTVLREHPGVAERSLSIEDFESAGACGIGVYEACAGLEVFDSGDESGGGDGRVGGGGGGGGGGCGYRGGSGGAHTPAYLRLYTHAVVRRRKLREERERVLAERRASDEDAMAAGPNLKKVRIGPVRMQRAVQHLTSTHKKRDREVARMQKVLAEEEMKECTFRPRTRTRSEGAGTRVRRSTSPTVTDRLYEQAGKKKAKLEEAARKKVEAEEKMIEKAKLQSNPRYAERVRLKQEAKKMAQYP
eukprot:Rhum_TRINITY_DN11666_c0_g1::Rhum_TRINITY_DN11666_c0_g1_i1::g.46047::m.46047